MRLTSEIYFRLIDIYMIKKKEMDRNEFCQVIGISPTNFTTYNRVIKILLKEKAIKISEIKEPYSKLIINLNLRKIERLIRDQLYFKKTDDFIHKSMFGAIT